MKAAQDGTKLFQSTLPVRGATCLVRPFSNRWIAISIHAPRAGSDWDAARAAVWAAAFQSTLPVRGATSAIRRMCRSARFQSTLPVRGATPPLRRSRIRARFQSTLPVRGATRTPHAGGTIAGYFNPRSPCGERPLPPSAPQPTATFQSTLPVRGATHRHPRCL